MSINKMTDILQTYKLNDDPTNRFKLPIFDSEGHCLGTLECVDRVLVKDPIVIAELTDWRARYMRYFLTQFVATSERTERWLKQVVLPSNDRMLFLICSEEGKPVGNFGVCNIGFVQGELDNLIRGRKGGHPKLVFYSEVAMLSWMFGPLSLKTANLHVFSSNIKTIQLHSSVGFTISSSQRLHRLEGNDEVYFLVNSDKGELASFSYLEMTITKDIFLNLHPWVAQAYPGLCI